MIEIIHVSDLHFGQSDNQNLEAANLLQYIREKYSFAPDSDRYLLVTGDITQSGELEQYQMAYSELSQFAGRVFLTPGNHDYGGLLGTAYSPGKAEYFDAPFASTLGFHHQFKDSKAIYKNVIVDHFGQEQLLVIGLNSCTKVGVWDFARGTVGPVQRSALQALLAQTNPATPVLVYLHHIPHKAGLPGPIMTLSDRKELMEIVAGRVDAIAFGHQGKSMDVDTNKDLNGAPTIVRSIEVMTLVSQGKTTYLLDANSSVQKKQYYVIRVENNQLTATVGQ